MSANKQQDSHRPPSDGGMAKEEFIRVGTTLYKIVEHIYGAAFSWDADILPEEAVNR